MNKFKEKTNIGLKIIALFTAMLIWIIVVNLDDPVIQYPVRNIPVSVVNSEVVTNKGKTFSVVDNVSTVTVTVHGKRSVMQKIRESNIIVTADLAQMDVNTLLVPLSVTIQGYEGQYDSAETNPKNIEIEIEDITKKTFPISVTTTGTPRDGYVTGTMLANPVQIEIGGSESDVNDIQKVIAKVNVSGMSRSQTREAELFYLDRDDNMIPMESSYLTNNLGEEGVSVDVQILNKKDVKLEANVSGNPAPGYVCSEISIEPEYIEVCGTEEDLENLETITIPSSEINVTQADSKQTFTVDISPYLSEEVQLVDATANNIVVTVKVDQKGTKTIEVPVEAIRIKNLSSNLKVEFPQDSYLEILVAGDQSVLETLDLKNAASIDLGGHIVQGTYVVEVDIEIGENATILSTPKVTVLLSTKE